MALPELVATAYENQQYNPKLQYLTGVARDDAAYMICKWPRFVVDDKKKLRKNVLV